MRYDDGKERLETRRGQLADAEQELSDEQLQARIDAAQAELSEQETAVGGLERQRTDETIPQLEARIARLDRAIQDRRDKRGNLKEKIAGLRSHVEALEGAGLDEAIQQKARELAFCEGRTSPHCARGAGSQSFAVNVARCRAGCQGTVFVAGA